MKIKHKYNMETIDVTIPNYGKHFGTYGYLTVTHDNKVMLFYYDQESVSYYDLTNEYEILEPINV